METIRRRQRLVDHQRRRRSRVCHRAIPFSSFVDTGQHIPPQPGDAWRFNLYRIGGKVNFQYMWSDSWREKTKYHAPKHIGLIYFSDATVGASSVGTQTELTEETPE